ncbi:MAG TPA: glycine/sarcosine/betaine reductase complex selenoprotein A, partial [Syntrophomonas sp.]|nr:glycine/sarcosine/betaine reductase complex selenoprotein A [Syntrophomonas sp.]
AMDMANQQRIKDMTDKYGAENVVVLLGGAEAESSGLSAETVSAGDPTYAGPLANVALGLRVYHIFELKDLIDPNVYEDQLGMMEMVMDVEGNISEVKTIREQYSTV